MSNRMTISFSKAMETEMKAMIKDDRISVKSMSDVLREWKEMNTQEEFEKWWNEEFDRITGEIEKNTAFAGWKEATERQQAKITALTEENRHLRDSQENTVKMLREVLRMLDLKLHL